MSETIVEVSNLTKKFKGKHAVKNASFKIRRGEIFGLIGQNGAGKSTLLKMISGLIFPTSGEIQLFKQRVGGNHPYFERMGVLIEQPGLYAQYNAAENLNLIALSYGMKNREKLINKLLKQVGLDVANKAKVKDYSMGMKQRLGIAAALIGSPDVLILDEPINGLDPQGISDIRELILELSSMGLTIIISSHILEELAKVVTNYAILHQGEIIERLSKEELLSRCEDRIEIEVASASEAVTVLEKKLLLNSYKVMNDQRVYVYDPNVMTANIVKALVEHGVTVHSIVKHKQSLEQYFLDRTRGGVGER